MDAGSIKTALSNLSGPKIPPARIRIAVEKIEIVLLHEVACVVNRIRVADRVDSRAHRTRYEPVSERLCFKNSVCTNQQNRAGIKYRIVFGWFQPIGCVMNYNYGAEVGYRNGSKPGLGCSITHLAETVYSPFPSCSIRNKGRCISRVECEGKSVQWRR